MRNKLDSYINMNNSKKTMQNKTHAVKDFKTKNFILFKNIY